jgi:hypothetical protein
VSKKPGTRQSIFRLHLATNYFYRAIPILVDSSHSDDHSDIYFIILSVVKRSSGQSGFRGCFGDSGFFGTLEGSICSIAADSQRSHFACWQEQDGLQARPESGNAPLGR